MAKGVVKKHTAAAIEAKIAAHKNKGGGTKGMDSRRPKCSLQCKICKAAAPSLVIMQEHYAAKHPKIVMNAADYEVKEE